MKVNSHEKSKTIFSVDCVSSHHRYLQVITAAHTNLSSRSSQCNIKKARLKHKLSIPA